jgi:tetratricopeptide (TPR) repeat protein
MEATPSTVSEDAPAGPSDGECAESFGQHRWRLSVEACTRAFSEHPGDARMALRIAHAHHARARLPEAGEWANRALALDATLAAAYVIGAPAERHARNPVAAVAAYRRYLTLAPRGWHASEARAAVRAHVREKSAAHQPPTASHPTAASTGDAAPSAGG